MSIQIADWLPLIQALGWTLLHFLWQGALVGAGYGLVRIVVPPERADIRYAAGLIALALMALCLPLTMMLVYPESLAAASSAIVDSAGDVITIGAAQTLAASDSLLDRALPWLVLIWVLGVGVTAARAVHQWRGLEQIAKRWARTSPELERMLARLSAHFGLVRNVRVLISEHIDTPTLIGWIKPVILMPTAVALGFPRHQVELILAHELGHLRRNDHLVNLVQAVIETLLFYHPLVHWISREVRNDREVCCDLLVLKITRGEPREYAQTLTSLEELRATAPTLAVAASGGVLLDRVSRIVNMPVPRLAATRPSVGLSLCVAAAVVLAGVQVLRPDRAELDALAAGAQAMLKRLPPPDAAMLAGFALRIQPPKWKIAEPSTPKLAVAREARPAAPVEPHVVRFDPLPAPSIGEIAIGTTAASALASVPDLAASAHPSLPTLPADTLPTVNSKATARPARAHRHLVVKHSIFPHYPDVSDVDAPVRVDVEFSVSAEGAVHDVKVLANDGQEAFGESARDALQQWRFDPDSVPGESGIRFRQSFVFAKPSNVNHRATSGGEDVDCVRRTGSLICRRPEEQQVGLPLTIIETNPDGKVHTM